MVYDKDGNQLQSVYNKDGELLNSAYDKDGTQVYSSEVSLKVMEYNVGGWYDGSGSNVPSAKFQQYYDLQYGTIHDNDPDILIINEYWEQFSESGYSALTFLQSLFSYVYAVPVASPKWAGRAFCSKYPLSGYSSNAFTGYPTRYFDRISVNVNGMSIALVVTHLGLTVAERQTEATELLTYLQSLNTFIMAGDLNTAASATTEGEDYINVIKPMIDAGFHVANCGEFGRFITYADTVGSKGQGSLDNIVCSANITIESVSVDERKRTDQLTETVDHMPLIAELLLP